LKVDKEKQIKEVGEKFNQADVDNNGKVDVKELYYMLKDEIAKDMAEHQN
jgi:Ca2+-binding EF-hand superfamily protein